MGDLLRVTLLAPTLDRGGAERQLVCLANGLAERGHDVCVALFHKTGGLLSELRTDIRVHDLKKKGRWDLFGFLKRLRTFVGRDRPDVIYSFLGIPNLSTLILKSTGIRIPVVWSVRASDVDLSRYGRLAQVCGVFEARLSRFADHIVVNSNAGMEHAQNTGFCMDKVSVIFNGIDTDRFFPDRANGAALRAQWLSGNNGVLVGMVARFDPMKDHETFFRAAALAAKSESGLRFVCVGEGPLEEKLRALSHRLGLSERVIWAGPHSNMAAVYNALDFICLSSISEGFPNVLGEAMACGVPCVTTRVGDAAYEVGDTGLVVGKGDVQGLAQAIIEMAASAKSEEWPDPRERIVSRFSVKQMIEETIKVLSEVGC
ncbi:glycosyltransferase [Pseudodesulfovibrio cashew]|uniref:Glycosyltransferase n=1 Tax=Pseudodesulfovibrio cashew TaxID=2678688 RepID=A0A6I6J8U0_9BACT|nr:glycosyltransferase [Pseudodesulfovibrio cashew]QGY38995.1 glycosyltransferase [Pseudodesulfovibrio cashew]